MAATVERNAEVVCPFCGCLYDHDELVAIYEGAASGGAGRYQTSARLAEFHRKVLVAPENAEAEA